jgi:hypothetical protein
METLEMISPQKIVLWETRLFTITEMHTIYKVCVGGKKLFCSCADAFLVKLYITASPVFVRGQVPMKINTIVYSGCVWSRSKQRLGRRTCK